MRIVKVSHSEAPDFCVVIPDTVDDTDQFLDSVLHGAAGWSEAQEVKSGVEMAAVVSKMMAK